ncbi:molybdopterin-guanine dinucleotide biosynthesis protein A [Steroidobacter denitrificans]|uniref:Molybdenum cofactor guanylyltransferase n=1 Tax=Steroidobacter denitrificans TaxID=465721 RepID=A0A127F672_STEDE|nr:molybdopterin-guanine dinucleotide biosynthesis protein A [Steroidobacter denitrificans]
MPPLFGLVLAGGASRRMQRDKAGLAYHGQPQLQWAFDLLTPFCSSTFVSVREEQRREPLRARFPQIVDRNSVPGPIAGIMTALSEHPQAAWLVLACDLPFLTPSLLRYLITHREPRRSATAYRSSHDGLPEPLCAIWEPGAREALREFVAAGRHCPRKFLMGADILLLDLPDAHALDNINTTQEFAAAVDALDTLPPFRLAAGLQGNETQDTGDDAAGRGKTLRIRYYAVLREQAGCHEETIDTQAATPAELYAQLARRHPFKLAPAQLKVALNAEFSDWDTNLRHGDTVVFIPPVAGG